MPIKTQNDLPAKEILENENIFVVDENRAVHQDIRPLQICILNLMPLKEDTELQLLRALSNTPLQVDISFMRMDSHLSQNTSASHLNKFYDSFSHYEKKKFDGLIITGAPVEQMEYEEVDYWGELQQVMEWSKKNVTSTLHICWGAQAGLYYHFGLPKVSLPDKLTGLFWHKVLHRREPLVRGFDDYFLAPNSRYTTVPSEAIHNCEELYVLAESEEAGVFLCMTYDGKQIYIMGHPEYDRVTLANEYERDLKKGLASVPRPKNYFTDDNPILIPGLMWRAHCNILYSNWLNYYVYQMTPYNLEE